MAGRQIVSSTAIAAAPKIEAGGRKKRRAASASYFGICSKFTRPTWRSSLMAGRRPSSNWTMFLGRRRIKKRRRKRKTFSSTGIFFLCHFQTRKRLLCQFSTLLHKFSTFLHYFMVLYRMTFLHMFSNNFLPGMSLSKIISSNKLGYWNPNSWYPGILGTLSNRH